MILDKLAKFAAAQSGTTSAASTDIIDTVNKGDAYISDWFVVAINTAFVEVAGGPTATFQLQTSDNSDFSGVAVTLVSSSAYLAASLLINKFWAVRIPPGAKRYLRGYIVQTSGNTQRFSAGAWDMFITQDIDLQYQQRYQI